MKPHVTTCQRSQISLGEALKSIIRVESAVQQSKKKTKNKASRSYFVFSALVPNVVVWPLQKSQKINVGCKITVNGSGENSNKAFIP